MSEKTEDNFEKGIFWELYQDLERQFQDFLEYVPYLSGNETVYSFKLLNLLLSIGGHVDSAFKEMARYPFFSGNDYCKKILEKLRKSAENVKKGEHPITVSIKLCLKAFEKDYNLSQKKVIFKRLPEREKVQPFKPYNPKTAAPQWWEIYNGLKHDVSLNIRNANLQTTMKALASAFLLNAKHIPGFIWLYQRGIAKPSLRGTAYFTEGAEKVREMLEGSSRNGKERFFGFVETPLFIYPA